IPTPSNSMLVEVKHFAPKRPVGVGVVRALYGVKALRRASKAMLVTSSYISPDAKHEFARAVPWELELREGLDVIEWCKTYLAEILDTKGT
ncbi:MAG: restriction endonuclease, partial [Chloroflexota bacterium]